MLTADEERELEAMVSMMRGEIADRGWTIAGSTGESTGVAWMLTVGLARAGQPELVVVGLGDLMSELILEHLGRRAMAGTVFTLDSVANLGDLEFCFGAVRSCHFQGEVLGLWEPLMEECTHHLRPTALQVLPPRELGGDHLRWSLADEGGVFRT